MAQQASRVVTDPDPFAVASASAQPSGGSSSVVIERGDRLSHWARRQACNSDCVARKTAAAASALPGPGSVDHSPVRAKSLRSMKRCWPISSAVRDRSADPAEPSIGLDPGDSEWLGSEGDGSEEDTATGYDGVGRRPRSRHTGEFRHIWGSYERVWLPNWLTYVRLCFTFE